MLFKKIKYEIKQYQLYNLIKCDLFPNTRVPLQNVLRNRKYLYQALVLLQCLLTDELDGAFQG